MLRELVLPTVRSAATASWPHPLLINAIPLLGLWLWHWDGYYVAMAVWLDTACKWLFLVFQSLRLVRPQMERLQIALVLTVFFGGFLFGHLLAIAALLAPPQELPGMAPFLAALLLDPALLISAAVMLMSYLWQYLRCYRPRPDRYEDVTQLAYAELRLRIWVMQLAVLGCAYLTQQAGTDANGALVVLILCKAAMDIYFDRKAARLEAHCAVKPPSTDSTAP